MEIIKFMKEAIFLIDSDIHSIRFGIPNSAIVLEISGAMLEISDEHTLADVSTIGMNPGLVAIISHNAIEYFIHINNKKVYCTPYLNGHSSMSINLTIALYSSRFSLVTTQYSYTLKGNADDELKIDSSVFSGRITELTLDAARSREEPYVYAKISYADFSSFLEYNVASKTYSLKSVNYYFYHDSIELKVDFKSNNQMILFCNKKQIICLISELVTDKQVVLPIEFNQTLKEAKFLKVNGYVFLLKYDPNEKESFIIYDKRADLLFSRTDFSFKNTKRGLVMQGEIDYTNNIPVDSIYTNRGIFLGEVVWHNENKFTAEIAAEQLKNINDMHSTILFKYNNKFIHSAYLQTDKEIEKHFGPPCIVGKLVFIPRLYDSNVFGLTKLPILPVYKKKHRFLVNLAYQVAKLTKLVSKKKVNLYFEKEASRACESSLYVFTKVQSMANLKSENLFILDRHSPQYGAMRKKFRRKIIPRFSFRHYYFIFRADTFIASELSNHAIATRILNDKLGKKLAKTPLYFLQHGIMFAKPVDNPEAMGFHKINQVNNIKKNVLSSDLEAEQFYKMGYTDADLMKTGLPKLDGATLKKGANKITYMPTWRFWEESYVLNNDIENTSYFKSIMTVIQLFEREGLLDRLLIAPHNKFAEYMYDHMREYKDIICLDPTDALEISAIFITDYSSIIYDATYRGAYPIFYWKDSEYLIEKYRAVPPVNKGNAPGVIAWTDDELMSAVKEAIKNNYAINEDILRKYRLINEFHDNKNTNRVIEHLLNDQII